MDNPETLETLGTPDTERRQRKNTPHRKKKDEQPVLVNNSTLYQKRKKTLVIKSLKNKKTYCVGSPAPGLCPIPNEG
jgi:hypothetical protein